MLAMSEPNLADMVQGDELADLPENVKLDKDEVVLYKYLCSIKFFCVLKIIDFTLCVWAFCSLFLESGTLMKICFVCVTALFLMATYREIKNFIHKGFYVTNKHLITYNGRKINLNDVWFLKGGSAAYHKVDFYENKSYIQDCLYDYESNDLDGFLMALYEVSGNRYILQFGSEKINTNALESNGVTFIKLIQE
nr:hypothetical protein [uncultured Campylobacter sp.]